MTYQEHFEQIVRDQLARVEAMKEASSHVHTASITYAVRDTNFDGYDIHEGDVMGLIDNKLSSIFVVDEDSTFAVTVYVGEQEKVDVNLSDTDVSLENVPVGMKAELLNISPRRATLRASKEVAKNVTAASLNAYVDLSECKTPGLYDLPLTVNEDKGVKCLTDVTVRVEITKVELSENAGAEE